MRVSGQCLEDGVVTAVTGAPPGWGSDVVPCCGGLRRRYRTNWCPIWVSSNGWRVLSASIIELKGRSRVCVYKRTRDKHDRGKHKFRPVFCLI